MHLVRWLVLLVYFLIVLSITLLLFLSTIGSGMSLRVEKIPISHAIDASASKDTAGKENTGPPPVPPPSVHNAGLAAKKKPAQSKKPKPKKLVTFEECLPEVRIGMVDFEHSHGAHYLRTPGFNNVHWFLLSCANVLCSLHHSLFLPMSVLGGASRS